MAATYNVVYKRINRPDPALVARAAACAMSDLYEALEPAARQRALMKSHMRPLELGMRATGPAVTARCAPRDNLMMHTALWLAQRGDVLVIDADAPSGAQWGMLAAVHGDRVGLAGVVVQGCVRDVDALLQRKAGVWTTEISPAHPEKSGAGAVNVPVECAGVRVRPGDVISADADGVLVLPQELLLATVEKAEQRARHERIAIAQLEAGRTLFEVHDLQGALDKSGVQLVDAAWQEDKAR